MHALELLIDILLLPVVFVAVLVGIGLALLLHWLVPAAPIEAKAALVGFSFVVGIVISWAGHKNERK